MERQTLFNQYVRLNRRTNAFFSQYIIHLINDLKRDRKIQQEQEQHKQQNESKV